MWSCLDEIIFSLFRFIYFNNYLNYLLSIVLKKKKNTYEVFVFCLDELINPAFEIAVSCFELIFITCKIKGFKTKLFAQANIIIVDYINFNKLSNFHSCLCTSQSAYPNFILPVLDHTCSSRAF